MANPVNFKPYTPSQSFLFPPSLTDMMPENHPVFTINRTIDALDLQPLLDKYGLNKEGKAKSRSGQNPYHPRMLLKVLVYGYVSNIYSSRKLEAACQENIHFMWLSGMQKPDHHTINRFRSERLKDIIKEVFAQVVLMLAESGLLSLKEVYTDGTKIESAANRYTFIWAKTIKVNRDKIIAQIMQLWDYSLQVAKEEMGDPTPTDFDPVDPKSVEATVEKINAALKDKPEVSKEIKAKLRYAKKSFPAAIEKYNQQEKMLAGRNSCSKTDPDATFMKLKEDHMENGQLKPAYNLQASTSNQFIVDFTIHPNPNDSPTLAAHLESHKVLYGNAPEVLVADAGYGSEQNLALLESEGVAAYVKHRDFDSDQQLQAQHEAGKKGKKAEDKKPFASDKLHYNEEQDCFICPMGQRMEKFWEGEAKTENGYSRVVSKYRAQNCDGCPLRGVCHKSKENRVLEISKEGRRLKAEAVARLQSEKGVLYRKQRCHDVEPAFGNVKGNHGFRRCTLRGKAKVEIETGLHFLAHNLRKQAKAQKKNQSEQLGKAA